MEKQHNDFIKSTLFKEERNLFTKLNIPYYELTVYFQPIFCAMNGSIFGYEALARHISRNINIKNLFSQAKEDGSVVLLDLFCRQKALMCASKQDTDSYLFINTCAQTLLHSSYTIDITNEFLDEFNIPKDRIIFEITEETAIENYEIFINSIYHYKKNGYKIAIDDFGAGFGGPKLLTLIEPDIVKIDRHFISNFITNSLCRAFVEFTISECHRRDILVVAEGIETYTQLSELISLKIDLLQGYYLGKPTANIRSLKI